MLFHLFLLAFRFTFSYITLLTFAVNKAADVEFVVMKIKNNV